MCGGGEEGECGLWGREKGKKWGNVERIGEQDWVAWERAEVCETE